MNYRRREAKDYARQHFKGIWAAALTPFEPNLALDEAGLRRNLRHWIDDLGIDGVFVCGKQGEFFSMSVAERKRSFDIAVEELGGHRTILSCSDQNLDTVIDLAKHAQAIGADYIVVHAPVLHFSHEQDDTLYHYYRTISEQVEIGIALWSHPDSGYLMNPELCARVADIANVVAIKYSVPRDMYARLTRLAGDKILVSTASEEEWFDNIVELQVGRKRRQRGRPNAFEMLAGIILRIASVVVHRVPGFAGPIGCSGSSLGPALAGSGQRPIRSGG